MQKLILLLGSFANPQKNAVSSTLAWMAEEGGVGFDVYYDAFRTGDHFGGGPIESAERGRPFGSTMTGHAHTDSWHQLLAAYECHLVLLGESYFIPWIKSLGLHVLTSGSDPLEIAHEVSLFLGLPPPRKLMVLGGSKGEDAYLYPVVAGERAVAQHVSASLDAEAAESFGIAEVETFLCTSSEVDKVRAAGIETVQQNTDYPAGDLAQLSSSLSSRWSDWCEGYFLGDPIVTAYFIPYLIKHKKLALYSEPLKPLINERTLPKISANHVVFGRMYDDEDALEISRLGGCWQLVDPGRPPFPAASFPVGWCEPPFDLFDYIESYSSEERLREHAENGDILTSIVFWSGCAREIENFYRLFELTATTGFRCGAAVTTETFARGVQTPFGLVAHPVEKGGVFPLVEPLLASSGTGFSLESYLPNGIFRKHLEDAVSKLEKISPAGLKPRGWWACLDTSLEPNPSPERRLRERPFGGFLPGGPIKTLHDVLENLGFSYAVSKVPAHKNPVDSARPFRALSQAAGRWQGWSPFHDIEGIDDIKRAERSIYLENRPGYILGTIDSCLWTFSFPQWERGRELKELIDFILRGGRSNRLLNVHPYAVYLYARYLEDKGYSKKPAPPWRIKSAAAWYAMRTRQGIKKLSSAF